VSEKAIIKIENLKKSFKAINAVDDLSFEIREGELFAFLGVNGAGKSTTINVLCGILKKDFGNVEVCGVNIENNSKEINRNIGVVFQNSVLDKKLTVYENLKYRAGLYDIYGEDFKCRLENVSNLLNLTEILHRPVGKLSGGQARRIDIARALIHEPKILILDEPTTGLDPNTRNTVWSVINKLRAEKNLTVLLTTHYMEEASEADYVVIIDGGKKVAEGTPHELKDRYASDYVRFYNRRDEAENYFKNLLYPVKKEREYFQVEFKSTAEISGLIAKHPDMFDDFEVLKGNMDDVFLKVTGKDLKGNENG
jgi:multidrug/hemolysin transport system ATP-binding protein